MKNITLPCTRDHLYLIAKISWLTCHKYLNFFNHYNKAYNEQFLVKCELEIDMAQQQLDTRFLNSVGICENQTNDHADIIIYNRLKRLYQDAQIIFKHDSQVADQFNFENILTIVTSI
jgi:hypothetical protein